VGGLKVWKYELKTDEGGNAEVSLPKGSKVLHVGIQHRGIFMWALVGEGDEVKRKFKVFGTGIDGVGGKYIGTVVNLGFVWHVFEV
jgi:hypothetical protein